MVFWDELDADNKEERNYVRFQIAMKCVSEKHILDRDDKEPGSEIMVDKRTARLYDYLLHTRLYRTHGGHIDIDEGIVEELKQRRVYEHLSDHSLRVTPLQMNFGTLEPFCKELGVSKIEGTMTNTNSFINTDYSVGMVAKNHNKMLNKFKTMTSLSFKSTNFCEKNPRKFYVRAFYQRNLV